MMSLQTCGSGGVRVVAGMGLVVAALGIALWIAVPKRSFEGRRLYVEQWSPQTGYVTQTDAQVQETLPTCKALMRLFKTVSASPQAALHRMSSSGKPNLQEWTDAIQDWKWGLSRSQISGMFRGIDTAMDGQVDIQELLSCFRHGEYEGQFWQTAAPSTESLEPANTRYNCYDGLDMWRFEWSNEKKLSCSLISASELQGSLQPGLTPAEVVEQIDTDRDGVISRNEWVAAATGFSSHSPFTKTLIEPRAEFAFKSIDVTQDGRLNVNDLANSLGLPDATTPLGPSPVSGVSAAALKDRVLARWSTLSNAFQKMDLDDNHRLSLEEFGAGLAEVRPPIDDSSAVANLFEGIDALHDGRITPPEWHGTMQSGQLFQTPEALQQVLQMGSAGGGSSWIHRTPTHAADTSQGAAAAAAKVSSGDVKAALGQQSHGLKELSNHLDTLSVHAEDKFREKAVQWAGSMKNACSRMGALTGPLSQSDFHAVISDFEPLVGAQGSRDIFSQIDEDKDGFMSSAECFLSEEQLRKQLSGVKSLRNTFCDADFNNDGQLTRDEFAKLGKLLEEGSSGAKYAALFDELAAAGNPPLTLAALETMAGKPGESKQLLSKEDGAKYGLPAIIHGKCVLAVRGDSIAPGLSDKVSKAFSTTLSQQLGVTIRVAGAQEQQGTTSKEFDVLYTSKTSDGAAVMRKMHENAGGIQTKLEHGVAMMISPSASAKAWCSSTMDFYGPKAGGLPKGQKIMQQFGQLTGQPPQNGSPYVAAR